MSDKDFDDINTSLEAPSQIVSVTTQYWKRDLDNNDFLNLYRRKGVAFRTINKQTSLMFKYPFTSDDSTALEIAKNFKFNEIAKLSYKNALISGWCLVYVDYGDIESINGFGNTSDYITPAPVNTKAISYYVIPRAWVARDIYQDRHVYETYQIYRADGSQFDIHKSRILRIQANEDGISKLEPAYDALDVLDNTIWGMGQTMFRSGSGFPILSIADSEKMVKLPDGTFKSRMNYYRSIGFLRDMNTQTGFMIDQKDTLKFEGAEGKAIKPGEYYDRAFQQVSVDLDVPVDILKGTSAGAVTGSETNLKEYYGDLNAKQITQLEPIYNLLFSTQMYKIKQPYKWKPIFEQTQQEIVANLKSDVESIYRLELYGYYTHEQSVIYFAKNYPTLDYDSAEINELKNKEIYIQPTNSFNQTSSDSMSLKKDEESSLPKKVQSSEKTYSKEMNDAFKQTTSNVIQLLQAFNTDKGD